MKSPAFTLIELIMVIAIVGILATTLTANFRGGLSKKQVATMAEQTLGLLQQAKTEVQAGHAEEGTLLCQGAYLEVGELPLQSQALYENGACQEAVDEDYGFSAGTVTVESVTVGGTPLNAGWLFFVPPDATPQFVTQAGAFDGEVLLRLQQGEDFLDLLISEFNLQLYEE